MHSRFNDPKLWADYDSGSSIELKAELIKNIIPNDVTTILDVGCGNGIITNKLSEIWDVTGLDYSEEALKHLQCKFVHASATDIPFSDRIFDLVLSSEMLEHLDNESLNKAINELKRVSLKYVLISVPNSEYLAACNTVCHKCGSVFHAWHHMQTFTLQRLRAMLMPDFQLMHSMKTGPRQIKWIPILLKFRQKQGQWLYPGERTICPNCGNSIFDKPVSNLVTKLVNGLNRVLCHSKPYWLVCLLERKV